MSQVTTAFIGVAHIHTPDFINRTNARSSEISVKAVYDHDSARGLKSSEKIAGSVFTDDPGTIFDDPSIQSVVICTETSLHKDLVVRAAKAGKHIFCEKPLGISADDAKAMAAAVNEAGVVFQTGFAARGSAGNRFIRQEVLAGNLGKITRAKYSVCHQAALDGWFDTDWRWLAEPSLSGGGAVIDLGAHALDLALSTFTPGEGEVVKTAASFGNRVGRYGSDIDEYGTALITFASGATATIEASWVDPALRSGTEVFGTEGQIQVKNGSIYYYSKHVEGADGKTPVTDLPPDVVHAYELFFDKLLGKPTPIDLITVNEAALESITMERIYKSAK